MANLSSQTSTSTSQNTAVDTNINNATLPQLSPAERRAEFELARQLIIPKDQTVNVTPDMERSFKELAALVKGAGGTLQTSSMGSVYENVKLTENNGGIKIEQNGYTIDYHPGDKQVTALKYPSNPGTPSVESFVTGLPDVVQRDLSSRIDMDTLKKADAKLQADPDHTISVPVEVNGTKETVEVFRRYDGAIFVGPGGNYGEVSSSSGRVERANVDLVKAALKAVAEGN